ncbi:MAG TPA: DUF4365 domain-containing protein [Gemmataceae bacterium]|nr:DUF4365 domain-containing protein [Gemmataceae bacterium]
MTESHQQEGLSRTHVRAVAARAGVICSEPEQDYGIDMCLRSVRRRGRRFFDAGGQVDLQVKSTTRASLSDTHVRFDLKVKNYDDLREAGDNCSRILVVVVLPDDPGQWLVQSEEELLLRHCAYWINLEGYPPTTSTTTVRIPIPRENIFSVEAVKGILAQTRQRRGP